MVDMDDSGQLARALEGYIGQINGQCRQCHERLNEIRDEEATLADRRRREIERLRVLGVELDRLRARLAGLREGTHGG